MQSMCGAMTNSGMHARLRTRGQKMLVTNTYTNKKLSHTCIQGETLILRSSCSPVNVNERAVPPLGAPANKFPVSLLNLTSCNGFILKYVEALS